MRWLLLFLMIFFTTPLAAQVRAPKKPANPPPAPRLNDGTPNLGPIEPNKGYWAQQQYQDYAAIAEPKEIWDGDTLVIDTVGFNEGTWIDMGGKPHTDQLHLVERLTRTDLYTLHYEATIDDPAAYIAPWKVRFDVTWDPNGQIQEYICQENNLWKDRVSGNSRIHLDSR
jgi:hypothetical protein